MSLVQAVRTRTSSVRTRLILWSVMVMAVVLTVLGFILQYNVGVHLHGQVDHELGTRGHAMAEDFEWRAKDHHDQHGPPDPRHDPHDDHGKRPDGAHGGGPFGGPFRFRPRTPGTFDRMRPRIFDATGKTMGPNRDQPWDKTSLVKAAAGREVWNTIDEDGESIRILTIPLKADGKVQAVLQLAYSLAETERNIRGVQRIMLTLIPVGLLFVGISAAFLTKRLLSPVREVSEAAARIGGADLAERLPEVGGDEFAGLARTLNAMLSRLEQSFEQQRRFTADASHELRTPLTAIKAQTSLALYGEKTPDEYRRALQRLDRSATTMSHIVQDLLLLARSDVGQLLPERAPLALRNVAEAAAETVRSLESAPIEIDIDSAIRLDGDKGHLVRLFTNLLANSARHTPFEGKISVKAAIYKEMVRITVRDTGSGIAPEHLPQVFERFYRADEARTRKHGGTGLGLSICRSIVQAHGGDMSIDSTVGVGTRVTVTLPLSANRGDEATPILPEGRTPALRN